MLLKIAQENPEVARNLIEILDNSVTDPHDATEGQFAVDKEHVQFYIEKAISLEYNSWMTYVTFAGIVRGLYKEAVVGMFEEHAAEEYGHAQELLTWLSVLGFRQSSLIVNPVPMTTKISEMIEILIAQEQIAISWYRAGLESIAGNKEGFRQMLETLVEKEQQHSNELITLLG